MPIPLPSEMTMNETAIAVSAPAMTALHDTPLQVALHAPCGEVITATLSPTIVVSSMICISRQCSVGDLRRQFSDGKCSANFAIQLPRFAPCLRLLSTRGSAAKSLLGTFPPRRVSHREVKLQTAVTTAACADKEESHA
jgi:hypothetical protein